MKPQIPRRTISGFSLIEMIGVLAIVSILLSVLAPSIIGRIQRAQTAKDRKALDALGDAFERAILRAKGIPNEENWARVIADELATPVDRIAASVARQPRVFLVDPEFHVGDDVRSLPYRQTAAGSPHPPVHARVLFLSSQGPRLPDSIASGFAADPATFAAIWDAPRGTIPPGWPPEWAGKGDVLQIRRLNLAPLFHRLAVNVLTDERVAKIAIDGGEPFEIPAEGWDRYYLRGSVIDFLRQDEALQFREILTDDRSYLYERGIWRGQLWQGRLKDATAFAKAFDAFLAGHPEVQGLSPAQRRTLADAYSNFVLHYATWSASAFPDYDELNRLTPEYQSLINAQSKLAAISAQLVFK